MWSKITSHIGLWLGIEDSAPSRPMRPSCSLSMLHNSHLAVVRNSKSSENLHHFGPVQSRGARGKSKSKKEQQKFSTLLSKTRGREIEVKEKTTNGAANNLIYEGTMASVSSYNLNQTTTPTKTIFGFLKPRRSRSSKNNDISVATDPIPSTSTSMTNIRRRRPRSAHYDPNTITSSSTELAPHDVGEYYRKIEKLGEGSYAKVYKCESKLDGAIVALKEISLNFQEGLPFTAIREASLLRTLRHANIVCLHDIFHQHHQLTFVFEYMKMDLSKYLEDKMYGLDSLEIKLLLFQLLRGLDFCHKKKILHRDLKPQNLLLDEDGTLKLADFGLARAKSVPSQTYSNEVVTLWYRPPDVLLGSTNYSTSLDMWGVGCIFAEICTGNAIFPGTHDFLDQLDKIFSVRGSPDSQKWPEVLQLPFYKQYAFPRYHELSFMAVSHLFAKILKSGQELLGMFLQLDPEKRVSAASAMLHPYFASLPREVHLLSPTHSIFRLKELKNIKSF